MSFILKSLFFLFVSLQVHTAYGAELFKIQTENPKLKKILERNINLKLNRKKSNVIQEINSLLLAKSYYTSSIESDDSTIKILNPIKWDFYFEGNKYFARHYLKKTLSSLTFSTSLETLIPELEQRILKSYKKSGFHFVKISSFLKANPKSFRNQIVFKIKERSTVKIKNISFIGEFGSFSKKDFRVKFLRYAGSQISNQIYYDNAMASGLVSLKNNLTNLGYLNAYVGLEQLNFNDRQDSVEITIKIYVNAPTVIRSLSFEGNKAVSSFWLTEILNLRKGDRLNLDALQEGLDLLEEYYLQRGFLKVNIEKDEILSYSKDLKTAKINIPIQENQQVVISSIKVNKGIRTKTSIILRELKFRVGEVLTLDKINGARSNLIKLGFFSNIRINVLFDKRNLYGTPVEIVLSERKPGIFTAGFGVNSELGLTVKTFAGLEYKNINGTARAFSSRAELKRNLRKVDYLENRIFGSYLEPYLFETSTNGRINLSSNDEIWDINSERDEFTVIQSRRIDFIAERELTNHTTLFFNLFSLDFRKEQVRENDSNENSNEIQEVIASLGPSLEIDYRDNPLLPTKGSLSKIQVEYASPLMGANTKSEIFPEDESNNETERVDLEFIKVQSSYTFYKPFSKNLIWAQSFRGGYLQNLSDTKTNGTTPFPKSRAFFLGGATTIRGFDPSRSNERIPNDNYLETNGGILAGSTIGGGVLNIPKSSYYYLSKSELRFPISKDRSWWGSVFYDGGSVQITDLDDDYDPWRHAVGLGLRFNTPLGPLLNVEIAYKLDRDTVNNESAVQFHLSVSSF